jgi:hypothetical protein
MNWNQFIFSSESLDIEHMNKVATIRNRHLYLGQFTRYSFVEQGGNEFHLLGDLFSWKEPKKDNFLLLSDLSCSRDLSELIQKANSFCGEFILISRFGDEIQVLNDASALREVYYTDDFQHLASQVKLLEKVTRLEKHKDADALGFFELKKFVEQKIFVGDHTHRKNVLHLRPNHLLHLDQARSERFFPKHLRKQVPTSAVAPKCVTMIQGYLKAASLRAELEMGVTGGYDSRLLFLASLGLDCRYFVRKQPKMAPDHWEMSIPKRLTRHYNQPFVIEHAEEDDCAEADVLERYLHDLDFPRPLGTMRKNEGRFGINGNVSEVARNYYEYHSNVTANDLSCLIGHSIHPFSVKMCSQWIQELEASGTFGYHLLDLFYWEERIGNWCAKKKTETLSTNKRGATPFNSRELLQLMLSTPRKDRDKHASLLYDTMLVILSNSDKAVLSLPINPSFKIRCIRLLKKIGIFQWYRFLALKTRII